MRVHSLRELEKDRIGKLIFLAEPDTISDKFRAILEAVDLKKNRIFVRPLEYGIDPYWLTYGLDFLAFY